MVINSNIVMFSITAENQQTYIYRSMITYTTSTSHAEPNDSEW